MYVCMYVCNYEYIDISTVRTDGSINVCMYVQYTGVCIYVCMHACMYVLYVLYVSM